MNKFLEAQEILNGAAVKSDSCIVFYSGGKDSLAVMNLATKAFKRVVGVFMYFVPGLDIIETQLEYAREKWNIEIVQVPHWILFRCMKYHFYNHPAIWHDKIPEIKLKDIYEIVMKNTGIPFIATGSKLADNIWRRQNLDSTKNYEFLLTPLKNWNKFDVLYYLSSNGIKIPEQSKKQKISGVDLTVPSLLYLYDNHREDFKKIEAYFPFIGAVRKGENIMANEIKNNGFEKFTIEKIKRSQIRLAEYNPRTITPEARKLLKDNIKRVGLLDPIIWNRTTGNVVSGHQRLQCLDTLNEKKAGDDYELTVSAVELDEKTEKEQNIFMNNPFAQGEYDQIKLPDLLKDLEIDLTGFDATTIHKEFGEDILHDKPEELKKMAEKFDAFSEQMTAMKNKSQERDNDNDFYLVLVFKNYQGRKEFTDKYGLEDRLYCNPATLESRIITAQG